MTTGITALARVLEDCPALLAHVRGHRKAFAAVTANDMETVTRAYDLRRADLSLPVNLLLLALQIRKARPGEDGRDHVFLRRLQDERQGSLRDHGNWVDVQMDGVPRHYGLFHDINEQVGRGILRRAIQEYVDRRPSAFEEARLDALLRELSDVEVDLDKTSASEDELWLRLPDAYEKARHLREILAAVDHAAADDLPPVSMPNDPYER